MTDLDINSFIQICYYLPTGMILRCAAVCKHWNELAKSDDLWIMILGVELQQESGLSEYNNIKLNREIAIIWKAEFQKNHKDALVKDVYMKLRRDKIKWAIQTKPGYKQRMMIFPKKQNNNENHNHRVKISVISSTPGSILKFLNS